MLVIIHSTKPLQSYSPFSHSPLMYFLIATVSSWGSLIWIKKKKQVLKHRFHHQAHFWFSITIKMCNAITHVEFSIVLLSLIAHTLMEINHFVLLMVQYLLASCNEIKLLLQSLNSYRNMNMCTDKISLVVLYRKSFLKGC